MVFAASFGTYFMFLSQNPENASVARAMGLTIIMLANLFLVQVNSSNSNFAIQSMKYLMKDKVMWAVNIATIAGLLLILYTPLSEFLKLAPLTIGQFIVSFGIAAISVLWIEIVKLIKLLHQKTKVKSNLL